MNNKIFFLDDKQAPKEIGSTQPIYNILTDETESCILVGIDKDDPIPGATTYYLKADYYIDHLNDKYSSKYGYFYCCIIECDDEPFFGDAYY